ncbi:MAG TPA: hypothetical protein VFL81_00830 [Candidatus Saccharimonadales bacterium]|nr:hypothetical protein [Candidatus Saccharimonadales bacterium]
MIEAQRQADFEAFEYQRNRTDELTEASEKLAAPMYNQFEYRRGPDGELYFEGQAIGEVFETGVRIAEALTAENPQFYVELVRRHLEYDEYLSMKAIAYSEGDRPAIMVKISPIPDAVVQGLVDLNAYDRERKKTLVRVFERTEEGLRATSVSLDRSDRDGLRAVAELFGETISDDDSSEDILFKSMYAEPWQFADDVELPRLVRRTYDKVLEDKYGGRWLGGRQDARQTEALQFIESQSDLITEHMTIIRQLKNDHASRGRLERARHNFAAALDRRLRGEADAGSLDEAGDIAISRGQTFESDCPTGTNATANSLSALGIGNKKQVSISKHCPICGAANVVTTIEGEIISGSCGCKKEICTGKISSTKRLDVLSPLANHKVTEKPVLPTKRKLIRQRFGEHAMVKTQTTIGGADKLVVDKRTGQVIAKL